MAEKLIFVYGRLYFYLKLQHPSRVFEALKFLPFPPPTCGLKLCSNALPHCWIR